MSDLNSGEKLKLLARILLSMDNEQRDRIAYKDLSASNEYTTCCSALDAQIISAATHILRKRGRAVQAMVCGQVVDEILQEVFDGCCKSHGKAAQADSAPDKC